MIRFNNISYSTKDKKILNNISFDIKAGDKIAFTGPSGSGKSTILKMIMGAIIPTEGDYYYRDELISNKNIQSIRQQIAYVSQEPVLAADIVEEALLLPFSFKAHRHSVPDKQLIINLLQEFHLDKNILKQKVKKISGGEKQRIALIRALLLNKKIFLLDEITSALDNESKVAVSNALLKSNYTILSVSHDKSWIDKTVKNFKIVNGELTGLSNES